MPGGDRTGPAGAGPRTGRGLGDCSGYEQPRFGFGFGRGRGGRRRALGPLGRGFGFGRGLWGQTPTAADEANYLKSQAEQLQQDLDAVQRRLSELEES